MTPESRLRAAIVRRLKKMKLAGEPVEWKSVVGSAMQRRGEPDLDICYHGRAVKLECKAGRNKPTKLQSHRLEQWRKAGAVASAVWSVADFVDAMSEALPETETMDLGF